MCVSEIVPFVKANKNYLIPLSVHVKVIQELPDHLQMIGTVDRCYASTKIPQPKSLEGSTSGILYPDSTFYYFIAPHYRKV